MENVNVAAIILNSIDEGKKQAAQMFWDALLPLLRQNVRSIIIFLAVILIVATIKALFGDRKILGSVLFKILFLVSLLAVGLCFGPKVFVSDYFPYLRMLFIVPLCYFVVGKILKLFNKHRFSL